MFDVWEKITRLRNERGWTVYKLAKTAGIPQSTMATWIGQGRSPSVDDLEKLCAALEISLGEFFMDDDGEEETRLRKRRKALGMSIEELSKATDIPTETIYALDCGKKDIIKAQYRVVKQLATALSCTTDVIT